MEQQQETQVFPFTVTETLLMGNIIRLCATRGAFTPEEFVTVGSLYNKIASFFPKQEAPAEATDDEPEAQDPSDKVVEFTPEKA